MHLRRYYDNYWEVDGAGGHATPSLRKWTMQRRAELIKALNSLSSKGIILDAGCGLGEFSELLAVNGHKVVGIDIAHTPLRQAAERKNANLVGFSVASVEGTLPFANETFAAIWSTEVIEHLFNVKPTFSEFQRILKPNGILILTTPFHGILKNLLLSIRGYEQHYDPTGPHIRFYTQKSLRNLLSHSGFDLVALKGIGRFYPVFMSHFVVARKTLV